eukprot:50714-Amphidinium_carterae.1
MRTTSTLFVNANRFSGTLPNIFGAIEGLGVLCANNNDFEGRSQEPSVDIAVISYSCHNAS